MNTSNTNIDNFALWADTTDMPVPRDPLVAEMYSELLQGGARAVDPSFSIATEEQGEVVLEDHRLLLARDDEQYQRYQEVMTRADVPHLEAYPVGTKNQVVASEIPRDARVVSQVLRSKQPKGGEVIHDVFYNLGHNIRRLIKTEKVVPSLGALSLRRILIDRTDGDVIIPPTDFEPATEETQQKVINILRDQLTTEFQKFGGEQMFEAFKRGVEEDGSN